MRTVYFDTSVFLAIFNGEQMAEDIRQLLRELKNERVRIYTSIITIQEVSVAAFRRRGSSDDNHAKVGKLARVASITKEIALSAAKLEAQLLDLQLQSEKEKISENRRRKWDCFHIATALAQSCDILYALDGKMLNREHHLHVDSIKFLKPQSEKLLLPFDA